MSEWKVEALPGTDSLLIRSNTRPVCHVYADKGMQKQRASLIAAAPQMLELLISLAKCHDIYDVPTKEIRDARTILSALDLPGAG